MFNNIITELIILAIVGLLVVINITLGSIIANKENKFEWSKFWNGVLKAITIGICVFLFCICLELVPIVLTRIGIEIPNDLITVLEVIFVSLTAYRKYAKDCIDKFKTILNIKDGNK